MVPTAKGKKARKGNREIVPDVRAVLADPQAEGERKSKSSNDGRVRRADMTLANRLGIGQTVEMLDAMTLRAIDGHPRSKVCDDGPGFHDLLSLPLRSFPRVRLPAQSKFYYSSGYCGPWNAGGRERQSSDVVFREHANANIRKSEN